MARDNTVEFDIVANTDPAAKSIKNLESIAASSVSAISETFSKLQGAAKLALSYFAGRAVVGFFEDSVDAAIESESAVAQLTQTLKSLGEYTPDLVQNFTEFATQLQANSKFSDEAVLSQLSLAKQLGRTDEQAKLLVQTAADLATANNEDLSVSFDALAKTLQGSTKALGTSVADVRKFTEEQAKAGDAILLVSERLKGSAKAAIDTYGGAVKQAGFAFGDFQEALGTIIIKNPALIATIQQGGKVFAEFTGYLEANGDKINDFITLVANLTAQALPPLIDLTKVLVNAFAGLVLAGAKLTEGLAGLAAAFLSLNAVKTGVEALVNGVTSAFGAMLQAVAEVLSALGDVPGAAAALSKVGVDLKSVTKSIEDSADALSNAKFDVKSLDNVQKSLQQTSDEAKAFGDGVLEASVATNRAFNAVSDSVSKASKVIAQADSEASRASIKAANDATVAGQARIKASVAASKAALDANEADKKAAVERKKMTEDAIKLLESITYKSLDETQKVAADRDKALAEINKFYEANVITAEQAATARTQIEKTATDKYTDLNEKAIKEVQEFKAQAFKDDLDSIEGIDIARENSLEQLKKFEDAGRISVEESEKARTAIITSAEKKTYDARVKANEKYAGVVSNFVTNGLQGLASSAVSLAVDTIAPGFGAAAGQIFGLLTQNTEQFSQTLDQLFSTDFIDNLSKNLVTFLSKLPELIQNLVTYFSEHSDEIIEPLIEAIIASSPKIGAAMAQVVTDPKFIEAIALAVANGAANGLKNLAGQISEATKKGFKDIGRELTGLFAGIFGDAFSSDAIYNGLKKAFDKIAETFKDIFKIDLPGSGGGGGVLGKVGGALSSTYKAVTGGLFADGGVVPSGFPNDSYPARLTSGELVVPTDLVTGLSRMIARDASGGGDSSEINTALLTRLVSLMESPTFVTTSAEVNGRAFADIILELNRNNARLTA